jgi:hypothetical protein
MRVVALLATHNLPHAIGQEDPKVGETTAVHGRSVGSWRNVLSAGDAESVRRVCLPAWRRVDPSGRFDGVVV